MSDLKSMSGLINACNCAIILPQRIRILKNHYQTNFQLIKPIFVIFQNQIFLIFKFVYMGYLLVFVNTLKQAGSHH
jgi:hypothetical protein